MEILPSSLFKLDLPCPNCGAKHLDTPGDWGDCRRCDFPLRRPNATIRRADEAKWREAAAKKARP